MTRKSNPSKLSGKWRTMTKECCNCDSKLKEGDKIICNFGGINNYISTKVNRVYSKCTLKDKELKN